METTLTDHSRWPRGMCRERTTTVKLECAFTHFYQKDVSKLARNCRSMYGTRDVASIWGDTWSDVLQESSMKVGTACPAFFCSCDGISKDCATVMTSVWLHDRSSCKPQEKSLRNGLR